MIISFDRASSNIFKLTPSINLNETNSTIKCLIKMDKSMYIVLFSPKSQKKWMLNNERIDIEFEISGIKEKFNILMISEKLISGIII